MRDGLTGWIVDDVAGMVDALGKVGELDRAACRRDAEARFGGDSVVNAYEALYLGSRRPS